MIRTGQWKLSGKTCIIAGSSFSKVNCVTIMAQKDYIKRGNPKAKSRKTTTKSTNKKASSGKKPQPNKGKNGPAQTTQFPLLAMTTVLLILGGFGYFLWSINGAAQQPLEQTQISDNNETKVAIVPAKKPTTKVKEQSDLPPPPKEEQWQYIEELKNKTVDVAVTKVDKKGPFLMQCATFRDGRRAEAFKAQLALLGFESRIKVTQGSNGPRHRVQLGPYEMNRDAQRARHKLAKHKINGCKIWLWT